MHMQYAILQLQIFRSGLRLVTYLNHCSWCRQLFGHILWWCHDNRKQSASAYEPWYNVACNILYSSTRIPLIMGPIFIPPPRNEVRGGILESQCPSVRPSVVRIWVSFPAHNCFPFTPIIMKLHMQTPHESRMCPIDFEVKRSKVKVTMHKLLKMVSGA